MRHPGTAGSIVMALLPARGESLASFQQHDASCQQYASTQTGGQTPGQAATNSSVAGAALGTGLGAAAGALIGSASGRAGSGLLAGTLTGSVAGRKAAAGKQNSYNIAYTQCMVANDERVVQPAAAPVTYVAPYPGVVYLAAPTYAAPVPGAAAGGLLTGRRRWRAATYQR
jgi:hypothetical protein